MSHYLGRVSMQHHNIYSVIMEADGAEVRARDGWKPLKAVQGECRLSSRGGLGKAGPRKRGGRRRRDL